MAIAPKNEATCLLQAGKRLGLANLPADRRKAGSSVKQQPDPHPLFDFTENRGFFSTKQNILCIFYFDAFALESEKLMAVIQEELEKPK